MLINEQAFREHPGKQAFRGHPGKHLCFAFLGLIAHMDGKELVYFLRPFVPPSPTLRHRLGESRPFHWLAQSQFNLLIM